MGCSSHEQRNCPKFEMLNWTKLKKLQNVYISGGKTTGNGYHITTLCKEGRLKEALHILHCMDCQGIIPFHSIYVHLLQCCANTKALPEGRLLHAHILQTGSLPEAGLETRLVIMYAKCQHLVEGRRILENMSEKSVISWTAMISAYAKWGLGEEALRLYREMKISGCKPDQITVSAVISACALMGDLQLGKELHEEFGRSGVGVNEFVGSALIDMYVKCSSLEEARNVFDEMPQRNVVNWTRMIGGYLKNGCVDEALELFGKMPSRDVVSWNVMIGGCMQCGCVEEGIELFWRMPERDVVSWNAILGGCAQNGLVCEALDFFEKMPQRNVVSWNTMIRIFGRQSYWEEALDLFRQMKRTGIEPDQFTIVSVLSACANLEALGHGKEAHEHIIRRGFERDVLVRSSLVDMYAKCGCLEDACKVFHQFPVKNVGLWNVMISGYVHNGQVDEGLKLFEAMTEGNVDSWNSMIAGYLRNGNFDKAVELYQQMQITGVKADLITIVSILPAFANLASLQHGKKLHKEIIIIGMMSDVFVGSALVDMYAKCGSMNYARKVFDEMSARDVVSWTAIIVGYAMDGNSEETVKHFQQMLHSNTKPNSVTFVGVLLACCHAGLIDDGWNYFNIMVRDYQVTPGARHYCCMVDLLCRCGHLDEAYDFIRNMPIKPDAAVWGSLLAGCRIHGNMKLGELVADYLFEAASKNAAHYVLLSNMYAEAGRWNDVENVRNMMKEKGIEKMPGCSWIEINNKVQAFVAGY